MKNKANILAVIIALACMASLADAQTAYLGSCDPHSTTCFSGGSCYNNVCCYIGDYCGLPAGIGGAVTNMCIPVPDNSPDGSGKCVSKETWKYNNNQNCTDSLGIERNDRCVSNFCANGVCCNPNSCGLYAGEMGASAHSCFAVGDESPDGIYRCLSAEVWMRDNEEVCNSDDLCYSGFCASGVCCDSTQCGGFDENGDAACYEVGETKDFGRYVCVAPKRWGINDGYSCRSDLECVCGSCVNGLCCGPSLEAGELYVQVEAPFYPEVGYFSMTALLNKQILGDQTYGLTTIRDGDDVCFNESAGSLLSVTTNPEGEFYSIGGPTDSPPIVFVKNVTELVGQIQSGSYDPTTYFLTACDYMARCEMSEEEAEKIVTVDQYLGFCEELLGGSCRCVKEAAVFCEAPCVTTTSGSNAKMVNATTVNVTGTGDIELDTACSFKCFLYWETNPLYQYCSWYSPPTWGGYLDLGSGVAYYTDSVTITAVDSEIQDLRKPNISVQNYSFAGNMLLVTLKNIGDYEGYLDMASLSLDPANYTVSPDIAASNLLMAPGAEETVVFTINDLYGIIEITASFGSHYSKGGDCSGTKAFSEVMTVPVSVGPKSVEFRYRIISGSNVTCDLMLTNSTGEWFVLDTTNDLSKGKESTFNVPEIPRENYRWLVKCYDPLKPEVVVIPEGVTEEGWGFNVTA